MRGLFKDQEDGTFFAAEISVVIYDPKCKVMTFNSLDDDEIQIPYIDQSEANDMIKEFYADGKRDFTHYSAFLNEDAPCEEEESTPEGQGGNVRMFKGLFRRDPKTKEPWNV